MSNKMHKKIRKFAQAQQMSDKYLKKAIKSMEPDQRTQVMKKIVERYAPKVDKH